MSQTTATARTAARAPMRKPARQLRVVTGSSGQPRSGAFVGLCLSLLVAGLLSVLFINTAMAQGSFELRSLQATSDRLSGTAETLNHAIDAQGASGELAKRALALGMVPSESAAFLRLSDGKVLGVATPARRQAGFTVVTSPTVVVDKPAKPAGPTTTVTHAGTVTTTTVVTQKTGGVVVTTITSVDSATRQTTTTTTTTTPTVKKPTVTKPTVTKPAKAATTPATKPGRNPGTKPATQRATRTATPAISPTTARR